MVLSDDPLAPLKEVHVENTIPDAPPEYFIDFKNGEPTKRMHAPNDHLALRTIYATYKGIHSIYKNHTKWSQDTRLQVRQYVNGEYEHNTQLIPVLRNGVLDITLNKVSTLSDPTRYYGAILKKHKHVFVATLLILPTVYFRRFIEDHVDRELDLDQQIFMRIMPSMIGPWNCPTLLEHTHPTCHFELQNLLMQILSVQVPCFYLYFSNERPLDWTGI